jgi:hypothetical protein
VGVVVVEVVVAVAVAARPCVCVSEQQCAAVVSPGFLLLCSALRVFFFFLALLCFALLSFALPCLGSACVICRSMTRADIRSILPVPDIG